MTARAGEVLPVSVRGNVISKTENSVTIDNQIPGGLEGEFVVRVSEDTRVLNADTGMPVSLKDVENGTEAWAYVGPAVTTSIPPQAKARVLLIDIPCDKRRTEYVKVESIEKGEGGYRLKASGGETYWVPDSCSIFPYLTRNMLYPENLYEGAMCIIWADENLQAEKIMMFPPYAAEEGRKGQTGWRLESGKAGTADAVWVYCEEDGSLHKGWLADEGKWYYLNPETGVMERGFLKIDNKTYYLQEDGSMLTTPRTFKPDENGELK